MEHLFHVAPYVGYVYPNETVVPWGVLIVVYPYITGLVAGSFSISSLYHVFGVQSLKPVARLALLTALAFMVFVPMPLLLHLGHPERALNAVWTPHLTSAMAAFGYTAGGYLLLLTLEVFFLFRKDVVARSKTTTGLTRLFYRAASLWSDDVSERSLAYDRQWIKALALIGIPAAHILHGYAGFVFGSLKAREWWSSDLMPAIFLGSAVVSGVALLILLYIGTSKVRKEKVNEECLRGLAYTLFGFLIFTLVLELLEFINLIYKGREGIETIMGLIVGPIWVGLLLQLGGSIIPLMLLIAIIAMRIRGKPLVVYLAISAVMAMIAVCAMRWNVVIGGQELSKTLKGMVSYQMPIFGREGLLAALSVFLAPFGLLWILVRLFPPWEPAQSRGS